jgi:2-dehydropantoate 2-reductase
LNPTNFKTNKQTTNDPLKLLVFGAGAIGTYIGGSLVNSGNRAVFLERPHAAARLREHGMHIQFDGITTHNPSPLVAESIQQAVQMGPYDAAIFALKSYDTKSALQEMLHYQEQIPPIFCLQNGVENEIVLKEALGKDKVITGVVTSAIGRLDIGSIIVEKSRGVGIASGHLLSERLHFALVEAGLNTRLYEKAIDLKWSKLITNLFANASCAILDMSPSEVLNHPMLYQLEIEQLRETLRVMRSMGIRVQSLPATPVRELAFAVQYLPTQISKPFISRAAGAGRGAKMPSFHIDLNSKKGITEVDYLNGAVVRYAENLKIQVPVNKLLNDTLLGITQGSINSKDFVHQPESLLALWETNRTN